MKKDSSSKTIKNGRINSLTGLKVIAMLLIFWWHAPIRDPDVDLGARMCELLFVCSGFLVGYNYLRKSTGAKPTWDDSFRYLKKKFLQIWPLHAICAVVALIFLSTAPIFDGQNLVRFVLNLSLTHAWLSGTSNPFSFNGASWFISALLFCYFLSPAFCSVIKSRKKSIILLFVICGLRISMELISQIYPGQFFSISFHTFPLIRALEFFMGVLLVPIYSYICDRSQRSTNRKNFVVMTCLEIIAAISIIALMITFDKDWIRGYYVAAFLPLVLVFALDGGAVSRFLSLKPFLLFSKIQFNFYILHQVIIRLVSKYNLLHFVQSKTIKTAILFVLVLALSTLFYLATTRFSKVRSLKKKAR